MSSSSDEIPEEVRRFITANIHSVGELEALLLLRSSPLREWPAEEVATRLFIQVSRAEVLLNALSGKDLLERVEPRAFRYAARPELRPSIDRVAETHASQLVALTKLIHALASTDARQFSEAFRVRKDRS